MSGSLSHDQQQELRSAEPGDTAQRLEDTLHRLQRLQRLTSALLAARSREEVLDAVLTAGKDAVAASAIAVALVDASSPQLSVRAQAGFDQQFTDPYTTVLLATDTPLTRAFLQEAPQAFPDARAMRQAFPGIELDPAFEARAAVPILAPSGCLGGLTLSFAKPRLFDSDEIDVLLAVSRQAGLALERCDLAEEQEHRQQRDAFLSRAAAALSGSLEARTVVDSLVELVVPGYADWVFVHLLDDEQADVYRLASVGHVDPGVQAQINALYLGDVLDLHRSDGAGRAIRTREPLLQTSLPPTVQERLAAAPADAPLLPVNTGIVVPLLHADLCLGAITVAREGAPYTEQDAAILLQVADRAAVALSHAVSYQQQRRSALELQLALLPPQPPDIAGLDIAWEYRPGQLPGSAASLIGGDWYDVVAYEDHVLVTVGDVMGRGPSAAAVMGQLRTMLRTLGGLDVSVPKRLIQMDEELQRIAPDRIATTLVLELDLERMRMTIANAGHLPPVVHDDSGTRLLETPAGLPLGVGGGADVFTATEVPLRPGTVLVLYTDGLVEERRHSLDERLRELTSHVEDLAQGEHRSAREICQQLLHRMGRDVAQDDDLALLVVRFTA